jgi:hypothetical protein
LIVLADTVKLQVPLKRELHQQFKLASVQDGFDMTEKVRGWIEDFLKEREGKKIGKDKP